MIGEMRIVVCELPHLADSVCACTRIPFGWRAACCTKPQSNSPALPSLRGRSRPPRRYVQLQNRAQNASSPAKGKTGDGVASTCTHSIRNRKLPNPNPQRRLCPKRNCQFLRHMPKRQPRQNRIGQQASHRFHYMFHRIQVAPRGRFAIREIREDERFLFLQNPRMKKLPQHALNRIRFFGDFFKK